MSIVIGQCQFQVYIKLRIFGIFNVSSRTSSIAGGRGVGLALCKRVAELHGGEISARNNQNSPGASFIFTLAKA